MAIDALQSKIRKMKNPSIVQFTLDTALVPEGMEPEGFFVELLEGLKQIVPGVRFSFSSFVLWGAQGVQLLQRLLSKAVALGYYVVLDGPMVLSYEEAQLVAGNLEKEKGWEYHGLVVSAWAGSDVWKGLLPLCEKEDKDIFVVVRSAGKSAPELQDLITGGRLVHLAAADQVNRRGLDLVGKYGYSRLAAVSAATVADVNRNLRSKYKGLFLLVEGYDYRGANAKNCAAAFDKLGHGAVVCAGSSIVGAWKESDESYVDAAQKAALRMKKNITNYITVL